jgi:hypothetical protein
MADLANERVAVAKAVKALNLKPVMAETILPDGQPIWYNLEKKIDQCDLFILLLGERYGWEPKAGYGAGLGKSVTHLEVLRARDQQLPILPFKKHLSYQPEPPTDDEILRDWARRDQFRKDVGDWQTGGIVPEFRLYDDLEVIVRDSLLSLFQDTYLRNQVREARVRHSRSAPSEAKPIPPPPLKVPHWLRRHDAVLVAGAGVSINAGLPNASTLADVLIRKLGLAASGEAVLQRYRFADVAALADARLWRKGLLAAVQEAFDMPQTPEPTIAHRLAVRLFSTIVTTNYDDLFELACQARGLNYVVYTPNDIPTQSPPETVTIFKLDGSIAKPDTLVLTDSDAVAARSNTAFWAAVTDLIAEAPLAVVGHSVRDKTTQELLSGRRVDLPGVYVAPGLSAVDEILLQRLCLLGLSAEADNFMEQLSDLPASH